MSDEPIENTWWSLLCDAFTHTTNEVIIVIFAKDIFSLVHEPELFCAQHANLPALEHYIVPSEVLERFRSVVEEKQTWLSHDGASFYGKDVNSLISVCQQAIDAIDVSLHRLFMLPSSYVEGVQHAVYRTRSTPPKDGTVFVIPIDGKTPGFEVPSSDLIPYLR